MEIQIAGIYIENSENESASSEALAPAVAEVSGSRVFRRPLPRFPSPPTTIVLSDNEDGKESGSSEALVPGPGAIRRALKRLPPAPGTINISDEEEDDVVISIANQTVPEGQQRLVPDADPRPGPSRPDTSVPLRSAVIVAGVTAHENVLVNSLNEEREIETEDQNMDLSCPDVLRKLLQQNKTKLVNGINENMRLRKELEEDKEKIQNQEEELEALKTDLDKCRRELRKKRKPSEKSPEYLQLELKYKEESQKVKKLKEQLEKEKKKVECLEAGRKGTAKKTPASKSRAIENLQQKDAVAGPSRKAPVMSPPPAKKMRRENVIVAGEQVSPKLFACQVCERAFASKYGLAGHSKMHKNLKQTPRAIANKDGQELQQSDKEARKTQCARKPK